MIFCQARRRAPGRGWLSVCVVWDGGWCLCLLFFRLLYRFRRHGMQNVPRTGPIIIVSNHQSHYDPPIVGLVTGDRPFAAMARSTLANSKIIAFLMKLLGAIPLKQGEGDSAAFKVAFAELQAGRTVMLFPEGSRTRDGSIKPFKRGVSLLIKRSGAMVLPVALEGAFDVWTIGAKRPKWHGWIESMAGEPISAEELLRDGPDAALEILRRRIEEMRLELRTRIRARTRGKYPAPGPGDVPYWELESQEPVGDESAG